MRLFAATADEASGFRFSDAPQKRSVENASAKGADWLAAPQQGSHAAAFTFRRRRACSAFSDIWGN